MIMLRLLGRMKFLSRSLFFTVALVGTSYQAMATTVEETEEASAPTFPVVHRILKSACGRCHQDGNHRGGIQLNTPLQVNRDAALILQSIESGDMPYMDPTWYRTIQGQTVIRYLKAVIAGETELADPAD
jgi:uncharacterized membrane protein